MCQASAPSAEKGAVSCCRFDGHRDWVFHEAGGGHAKTEVQSRVQGRGGQACQGTRGVGGRKRAETWASMRTCCANG